MRRLKAEGLFPDLFLYELEKLGCSSVKSTRQFENDPNGWLVDSSLNQTDKIPFYPCVECKLLLR